MQAVSSQSWPGRGRTELSVHVDLIDAQDEGAGEDRLVIALAALDHGGQDPHLLGAVLFVNELRELIGVHNGDGGTLSQSSEQEA